MIRAALLLLLALTGLSGCERAEPPVFQRQFFAFGTLVDITIAAADTTKAAAAADAVERDFNRYHQLWHPWHPGPLTELNRALAAGTSVQPAPSLRPLLELALPLAAQSGYRFDPAIGGLVALWGFHADEPPAGPPPSAAALAKWSESRPSAADLHWQQDRLSSTNPALQLDFGAFAKGYAVDEAMATLRGLGVEHAIVNAGGDLRAMGRRGARAWRIGVRHPRAPRVLAAVEIRGDESVFTSGDYERFYEYEGQRFHHILDPHSGRPATGTRSVTVIHADAASADAAATALFVAGPKDWWEVARAMGIRYVLLMDERGVAHMNPAMGERVQFEAEAPPIQWSPPLP